jgi:hypothetical protein
MKSGYVLRHIPADEHEQLTSELLALFRDREESDKLMNRYHVVDGQNVSIGIHLSNTDSPQYNKVLRIDMSHSQNSSNPSHGGLN